MSEMNSFCSRVGLTKYCGRASINDKETETGGRGEEVEVAAHRTGSQEIRAEQSRDAGRVPEGEGARAPAQQGRQVRYHSNRQIEGAEVAWLRVPSRYCPILSS